MSLKALKKIQFYLSNDIVLHRELSGGKSDIVSGEIKMVRGKQIEEVIIKKMGNAVVLLPQKAFYDALLESLAMFSEDFLIDREQPPVQDRDAWLE